jgi:uncharacterized protein YjcR
LQNKLKQLGGGDHVVAINWDEIRREYETTNISLSELADKHGIKYPTIKSRKQRQGWEKDASKAGKDASDSKRDASKRKRAGAPLGNRNAVGHGAPKGNKNAVGNSGGSAPIGNSNAVTHGFFRRIFPDDEETHAIIGEISVKSPLDILWENIVIQYTAIARAQKIMFVRDQQDETRVLKKQKRQLDSEKVGKGENQRVETFETYVEEEWEIQHAWDKHATFLQAQSRAMATLQGLIKRYEEMLVTALATEEQRLRVEKLKLEIGKLQSGDDDRPGEVVVRRWST